MSVAGLRARQVDQTRETILQSLMDLVRRDGLAGFSIQSVADAAGVAHRTVYRYFPSREALLEGLASWIHERFARALGRAGEDPFPGLSADELGATTESGYRVFHENAELVSTYVVLAIGARIRLPSRVARTRWFEKVLAAHTRHLSRGDARAASLVVRAIASATTWHHMTEHGNAEPLALARAARWAVETLLKDLAAGGGPRRKGGG